MSNVYEADKYRKRGELSLAEHYYKMAVYDNSSTSYAWNKLLEVTFLQGKKNKVYMLIDEIKARFPDTYYPYHIEFLMMLGDEDENIYEFLNECGIQFEDNISYQYDRFVYMSGTGNNLEAIETARKYLLENKRMLTKVAEELSDSYIAINDYGSAKELLERALNISGNDIFLVKLTVLNMLSGDRDAAIKCCNRLMNGSDSISKIIARFINSIIESNELKKKSMMSDVILECKRSDVDYPVRVLINFISVICYHVCGDSKKALEQLDFIDAITDGKIIECAKLRKIINDKEENNGNDMKSVELFVFGEYLQRFMDYVR